MKVSQAKTNFLNYQKINSKKTVKNYPNSDIDLDGGVF